MLEDIEITGVVPDDPVIRAMEETYPIHAVVRKFLLDLIPEGSVGAELGVYTGNFSAILAACPRIKHVTFVDPWWVQWGEKYPDWSEYTAFGRVGTRAAYELAVARIKRPGLSGRKIVVGKSEHWLASLPDGSLDWVYVDSSLDYNHKLMEFALLSKKLNERGVIMGDDWWVDPIWSSVNDWLRSGADFDLMFAQPFGPYQWMLRRRCKERKSRDNDLRPDGLALKYSDAVHTLFLSTGR